jgi:AmmeMemoRadiSam system protein A
VAAAFRDPRFEPLTKAEFATIEIEVSLLSAMEGLHCDDEAGALAQLRPGIDGVVLHYGHYRSTFLPQVWEQLPGRAEFLAHLKHKAGLPPHFWDSEMKLSRYTVFKWREADLCNNHAEH